MLLLLGMLWCLCANLALQSFDHSCVALLDGHVLLLLALQVSHHAPQLPRGI